MTTKNMAYDHAAYLSVQHFGLGQINGSGGASAKHCAFTAMQVKSITVGAALGAALGTSADVINVVKITGLNGTNTTTSTTAYGTMGSGAYFGNFTPAIASNQVTLQQGDVWWVTKGTDATATYAGGGEVVILPQANVTV